jgi:hypothetical protein
MPKPPIPRQGHGNLGLRTRAALVKFALQEGLIKRE